MVPNPLSPYAVSKIIGEHFMKVFQRLYSIETVILRYFNVYGPYQVPTFEYSRVISKFINAFKDNKPLIVYGDGNQSRDFTYVDDVVEANILPGTASICGEVFNIACGKRYSINQLIELLKKIFDKDDCKIIYTDPRPGDIKHSQAGIDKIKTKLGFSPKISFEEGLKRTVAWYLKQSQCHD